MTEFSTEKIIQQTQNWIDRVVIGLNFCPFAARVIRHDSVRYRICSETSIDAIFRCLRDECEHLDADESTETTLVIFPTGFADFYGFLDLLEQAENALLIDDDYEGIYQLASFHPDYLFDESAPDDPANFTNRSPYPMLHFLRESSIDAALETFDRADEIPEKNIATARKKGLAAMRALREACF